MKVKNIQKNLRNFFTVLSLSLLETFHNFKSTNINQIEEEGYEFRALRNYEPYLHNTQSKFCQDYPNIPGCYDVELKL